MKGLIMWEQKSGQDCCLCFWRQSASLASFRPARQGPYNRIRNRQERFVSQFLPVFYCSRLACCFAFHAAYSRCPCPSAPCRARRTLTGMILQQMACRRKSSRPFCVTWFVSLFFTHPFAGELHWFTWSYVEQKVFNPAEYGDISVFMEILCCPHPPRYLIS